MKWDGEGIPPAPTKQHLPKYSLLHTIDQLAHNSTWESFKYVYYTEGDLILHMRQPQHIFNMIDKSETYFLAVPHRMQTIPLLQDFPAAVHRLCHHQLAPAAVSRPWPRRHLCGTLVPHNAL